MISLKEGLNMFHGLMNIFCTLWYFFATTSIDEVLCQERYSTGVLQDDYINRKFSSDIGWLEGFLCDIKKTKGKIDLYWNNGNSKK